MTEAPLPVTSLLTAKQEDPSHQKEGIQLGVWGRLRLWNCLWGALKLQNSEPEFLRVAPLQNKIAPKSLQFQNLATGKYRWTEVRVYPAECGEQLGTDPSKIGSSKSVVLKSFSGEATLWDSSLPVSLTLWDTPALFTPPLPLPIKMISETKSETKSLKNAPKRPRKMLSPVQLPKNVSPALFTVLHPQFQTQIQTFLSQRESVGTAMLRISNRLKKLFVEFQGFLARQVTFKKFSPWSHKPVSLNGRLGNFEIGGCKEIR